MTVVWSERDDPGGAWRDCTYSAGLMALVHGGELDFPAGIYTAAEREALERSDSRPDETGANAGNLDEAIRNRYNRELHRPAPGQTLRDLLNTPNLCLVVPGVLANFPAGHWLRKWDPGFTGGHRLAVLTLRGGFECCWLDPLAPMGYPGDVTDPQDVLTFFGSMPLSELRYTVADEWVVGPAPTPAPEPVPDSPPAPEPTTQPGSSDAPPVGGEPEASPPPVDGTPAGGPDLSDHDRQLLEGAGLIEDGRLLTRDQVVERFSQSPVGDGE